MMPNKNMISPSGFCIETFQFSFRTDVSFKVSNKCVFSVGKRFGSGKQILKQLFAEQCESPSVCLSSY